MWIGTRLGLLRISRTLFFCCFPGPPSRDKLLVSFVSLSSLSFLMTEHVKANMEISQQCPEP